MKDQPRAGVSIHRMTRSSLILRAVCGAAFDNFATREFDFASTLLLWEGCGACATRIILGSHWVRSLPVNDTTSFYPILIHRKRSGCRDAISVPSGKSFSFLLQSSTHCRIPPHRLSVPRRLTSHFLAGWQPIVLSHMPLI